MRFVKFNCKTFAMFYITLLFINTNSLPNKIWHITSWCLFMFTVITLYCRSQEDVCLTNCSQRQRHWRLDWFSSIRGVLCWAAGELGRWRVVEWRVVEWRVVEWRVVWTEESCEVESCVNWGELWNFRSLWICNKS